MRVMTLVNTLTSVSSFVYANHVEYFVYTAKQRPDIEFIFYTPHRSTIDNARNMAAKLAMQYECEYLMFIDDDVLIPRDALLKLLDAKKDICSGLVIIRGYPFNCMLFKWLDETTKRDLTYYNDLPKGEDGNLELLVPCAAVGFSCCLIRTEILFDLPEPYFVTGRTNTEDVYFCMKIRDLTPVPSIFCRTDVRCGHLLNPEPIEYETIEKFKEFYKPTVEENKKFKRDQEYIDKCLAKLG